MRSMITRHAFTKRSVTRGAIMKGAALAGGLLLLPVAAASAGAQTIWHDHTRPQSVWLELNHVELRFDNVGFLTSSNAIGGRLRLSGREALTVEVPLGYADVETSFTSVSELGIGNPWIGFEYAPNEGFLLESAVRVPLADGGNGGAQLASRGEIVDRMSAYLDNVVVLHVVPNFFSYHEGGLRTRFRAGPAIWIPTEGGGVEAFLDYGAALGYEGEAFGGDMGLTGSMFVSGGGDDLGQLTLFQAGAQVYRRFGSGGRIGVLFRLPLDDDANDVYEFTLGLKASMAVN